MRELEGLGFREAVQRLGLPDTAPMHRAAPTRAAGPQADQQEYTPAQAVMPGPQWRERGAALVAWAAAQLAQAPRVLDWLLQERGLTASTAHAARLGWIPQDFYRPREAFGLPPERKPDGKPKRVWIPKGLCIPVFAASGELLRVKIRLAPAPAGAPERPKYLPLPQTEKCTAPLVVRSTPTDAAIDTPTDSVPPANSTVWQVVESELDALLLAQEIGRLGHNAGQGVNVVAMGSASYRPDAATWADLQAAPLVLVSLDFDDAGNKAACLWWEKHLAPGRFKLWPVPEGKDPCDAWRAGWNLAEWTKQGLSV